MQTGLRSDLYALFSMLFSVFAPRHTAPFPIPEYSCFNIEKAAEPGAEGRRTVARRTLTKWSSRLLPSPSIEPLAPNAASERPQG